MHDFHASGLFFSLNLWEPFIEAACSL